MATIRAVSRAPGRPLRTSRASWVKSRTRSTDRIPSPAIVKPMRGV